MPTQATRHAELEAIDAILSDPSLTPTSPDQPPPEYCLNTTTLYVTVEPCIMCGSALRQMGIKMVRFALISTQLRTALRILRPVYSPLSRYILAAVMNALAEMDRFYQCIMLLIPVTPLMKPFKAISEKSLL